nr:MAG TPA: hypothetical protein [Caudoviricetes sp.]
MASARAGVTAITGYLCRNTRVARFFCWKGNAHEL